MKECARVIQPDFFFFGGGGDVIAVVVLLTNCDFEMVVPHYIGGYLGGNIVSYWAESRIDESKLLCGLYALLLIEILVRAYYCSEKIDPNFPIFQNFAVKALGCAPWFPSLVSLLFVAAPSGAIKLEQPISLRCHLDIKFKFSPNHKPEK